MDSNDLFLIKCDPNNIKWGGFVKGPDKDNFKDWYIHQINNTRRTIYLVYLDDACVAFFYIDIIDEDTIEDTSGVLTQYAGRGIGTWIVETIDCIAIQKGYHKHIAWVSEQNVSSMKRYEKLKYKLSDDVDYRSLPLLGGIHLFRKWYKEL